ncbi:MAG: hypothetical protein II776_05935 [Clostridia bacterium]|nr:hypothetical protein [Clostridia bacterium]
MRRSAFYRVHPAVGMTLAVCVLIPAFLTKDPLTGGILTAGALLFDLELQGALFAGKRLLLALGAALAMGLTNPLISHKGVTVLFYLGRNPVTLESAVYGFASGLMLAAVLLWCDAFRLALPPDAPFRLAGRFLPRTALVLSMAARFVPRLTTRFREARLAQRAFHPENTLKGAFSALQTGVALTLEECCEIASNMEERGYGAGRRSYYLPTRFTAGDGAACLIYLALAVAVSVAAARGAFGFETYPGLVFTGDRIWTALPLILALIPALTERREKLAWRSWKSVN